MKTIDQIRLSEKPREEWIKRGRLLEYFTIGWNLVEGIISVGAGCLLAAHPSSDSVWTRL